MCLLNLWHFDDVSIVVCAVYNSTQIYVFVASGVVVQNEHSVGLLIHYDLRILFELQLLTVLTVFELELEAVDSVD